MIQLENGRYVIGFDDGYQLGKTANYVFDNGVHMLGSAEPTLKENSLFYNGEYFKVGEGRAAITEDKVSDEDARVRTMAAMAMELRSSRIHQAEVVLAVGLPFSNYGRYKLKLIDYYYRQSRLNFSYEGEDYSVTIVKVIGCPQCYSAIASRLGNMRGDYLIVDIGSWAIDIMEVQDGVPVENYCETFSESLVSVIQDIRSESSELLKKEVSENRIISYI